MSERWHSIKELPRRSGFVILFCADDAHQNAGCDYRYRIAFFNADPQFPYRWSEQGTNHDVFENAHEAWFMPPTHWRWLERHESDHVDPQPAPYPTKPPP